MLNILKCGIKIDVVNLFFYIFSIITVVVIVLRDHNFVVQLCLSEPMLHCFSCKGTTQAQLDSCIYATECRDEVNIRLQGAVWSTD